MILAALECMWVAEEVEENLLQQQVKAPKIRIARRRKRVSESSKLKKQENEGIFRLTEKV
jgi:hypothetical protein